MAEHRITKPLIFLVGTGRCGSTLVMNTIVSVPTVGYITRAEERLPLLGRTRCINTGAFRRLGTHGADRARAVRWARMRFQPTEAWDLLSREVSPAMAGACRNLTAADASPWLVDRLRRFFAVRAAATSGSVFVHKLTGWPHAGLLAHALPEARFVHVARDGRAVVNSWMQTRWWRGYQGPDAWGIGPLSEGDAAKWSEYDRSFAALGGIGWRLMVEAAVEAGDDLGPSRWRTIRYEDFLQDPRRWRAEIGAFVGVDLSSPDLQLTTGLSSARLEAFRQELSPWEIAAISDVGRSAFDRLGYEVGLG